MSELEGYSAETSFYDLRVGEKIRRGTWVRRERARGRKKASIIMGKGRECMEKDEYGKGGRLIYRVIRKSFSSIEIYDHNYRDMFVQGKIGNSDNTFSFF